MTTSRLTAAEEAALVGQFQAGDRKAGDVLLRVFEGLCQSLANFSRTDAARADALQVCRLGLLTAARSWDPARGASLATHATWQIRRELRELYINERTVRLPAWMIERQSKARKAGIDASSVEALVAGGYLSPRSDIAVQGALLGGLVSTDVMEPRTGMRPLRDRMASSDPGPEETYAEAEREAQVHAFLSGVLTDRERFVFQRRVLTPDPDTLEEIGIELGVTRERVRQIEVKARAKVTRRAQFVLRMRGAESRP